jgi:hypothetical protein
VLHGGRRRSSEGAGFGDVGRHGTDAMALGVGGQQAGHNDAGAQWQLLGAGGSVSERGSAAWGADRSAAATVPGGGTGRRARVAQCQAAQIQTGFKNISKGFKNSSNLTDPKGTFPCSKNHK